jgi:hypothetical protein
VTRNKGRRRGCQENHRTRDVHGLSDAMQSGNSFDHIGMEHWIGQTLFGTGVSMKVGATALTLIPCWPHSTARHLVRCTIAALVVQ